MEKHQIKIHWIVYGPDYKPVDGYFEVAFLKDSLNKARSLGKGSRAYQQREVKSEDSTLYECNNFHYEIE